METTYGYIRVSSRDQKEDRQLDVLKTLVRPGNIYMDKQSGKDFNRPQYKKRGVLFKLNVYLTMYFVFSFFQVSKQLVKVIVTFYRRVISNFFRLQHGGNRFSIVVFQIRIQIHSEVCYIFSHIVLSFLLLHSAYAISVKNTILCLNILQ